MTTIVRHILFTYKRIRNAIDYMFVRDLPTSNRDSLTDRPDCSARQSERECLASLPRVCESFL